MNDHPTIPEPVNVMVRALLRSPLHWTMSRNTMLLAVTGRKTQRVYQVRSATRSTGTISSASLMPRGGRTCATAHQ